MEDNYKYNSRKPTKIIKNDGIKIVCLNFISFDKLLTFWDLEKYVSWT